jgi:hypothetical protein
MDNETFKKKIFQKVKGMTYSKFWEWVNHGHTGAYRFAQKHYREAMEIELQPKQRKAVEDKVIQIREQWDNIDEVDIEDTGVLDMMKAEVMKHCHICKRGTGSGIETKSGIVICYDCIDELKAKAEETKILNDSTSKN